MNCQHLKHIFLVGEHVEEEGPYIDFLKKFEEASKNLELNGWIEQMD